LNELGYKRRGKAYYKSIEEKKIEEKAMNHKHTIPYHGRLEPLLQAHL
jgi:hypothetical protein